MRCSGRQGNLISGRVHPRVRQRITGWSNCPSKFACSSPRKHAENVQRRACRDFVQRQLGSRASLCSKRKKNFAWTWVSFSFSFSRAMLRWTEGDLTEAIKRMSTNPYRSEWRIAISNAFCYIEARSMLLQLIRSRVGLNIFTVNICRVFTFVCYFYVTSIAVIYSTIRRNKFVIQNTDAILEIYIYIHISVVFLKNIFGTMESHFS